MSSIGIIPLQLYLFISVVSLSLAIRRLYIDVNITASHCPPWQCLVMSASQLLLKGQIWPIATCICMLFCDKINFFFFFNKETVTLNSSLSGFRPLRSVIYVTNIQFH